MVITYNKIKTTIKEDSFISNIDSLIGTTNQELLVTIENIKVYELDNTIFVFLDMSDMNDTFKGLIVGSSDDKNFESLLNDIYNGKKCKVSGNFCTFSDDFNINLPFKLDDNSLFCIKEIKDLNSIQLYGIDINKLYNYDLKKAYTFVKENTDYLIDTSLNDIKEILFSAYKDIIILLKNGIVLFNGENRLNNVNMLCFISGISIFAITNKKIIIPLTRKDKAINFINANNYEYKKIITTPIMILGLTYDGYVKMFGDLVDVPIDYNKFINVEDICYVDENDDIVVIKDGKVYSLFLEYDYSNSIPDLIVKNSFNDVFIIE